MWMKMKSFNWLTPRDKAVYDYLRNNTKYASTSQLTELFFKQNTHGDIKNAKLICRRRLAALERNIPEIQSFFMQSNADKIYTIIPPKEYISALSKIEHSLKLNEIYIQVRDYAQQHGHTIYGFKIEPQLKDGIIPDVLLIYVINNRAKIYLIEYDTGSESLNKVRKKIDNYSTYFSRQHYLYEDWQPGQIKPEFVFVTTQARAAKIQKMGVAAYSGAVQMLG
jgi:hypothetical protein